MSIRSLIALGSFAVLAAACGGEATPEPATPDAAAASEAKPADAPADAAPAADPAAPAAADAAAPAAPAEEKK
jgi:hypothetical protein